MQLLDMFRTTTKKTHVTALILEGVLRFYLKGQSELLVIFVVDLMVKIFVMINRVVWRVGCKKMKRKVELNLEECIFIDRFHKIRRVGGVYNKHWLHPQSSFIT